MTADSDRFLIEQVEQVCVVAPLTNLDAWEWDLVEAVSAEILQAAKQRQPPRLLFDLSHVQWFGSLFISLLLRCWRPVSEQQGRFALCGLGEHSREVLRVSQLLQLWDIYPDRASALAAMQPTQT